MPDFPDWQGVGPVRYVAQLSAIGGGPAATVSVPVSGYERSLILYTNGDPNARWSISVIGGTTGNVAWGPAKVAYNHPVIILISPETEASYTVSATNTGLFTDTLDIYVGTAQPVVQIGATGHARAIPVLPVPDDGQAQLPAYVVAATSLSLATAGSHLLEIFAGLSQKLFVTRLQIWQNTSATAGLFDRIEVRRLTTAGTGGVGVPITPLNPALGSMGGAAASLPGVLGAEGALYGFWEGLFVPGVATVPQSFMPLDYGPASGSGPIMIPEGGAEGICLKNNVAVAGATIGALIHLAAL